METKTPQEIETLETLYRKLTSIKAPLIPLFRLTQEGADMVGSLVGAVIIPTKNEWAEFEGEETFEVLGEIMDHVVVSNTLGATVYLKPLHYFVEFLPLDKYTAIVTDQLVEVN